MDFEPPPSLAVTGGAYQGIRVTLDVDFPHTEYLEVSHPFSQKWGVIRWSRGKKKKNYIYMVLYNIDIDTHITVDVYIYMCIFFF